jgi:methionyl-tRNA formyltransferase
MDRPRIVFMGTPEFAVPSLQILIDRRENLAGVVTQPDKPVGRGQHVKLTPIKELALKHHIAVFQPQRVKSPDFVQQLKTLAPDLVVVAAYGQIFSRALLDIPSCGFINVHSSLLPSYRGAAPINWALINGDTETGVTIMLLDEGMDTGDILLQGATSILADENASMLHDRLAGLGAKLLGKTLDMLRSGSWSPVPQNHEQATYAPMLKKKDGRILWDQDALSIANQVRGMTPWPGCYTYLQGKLLKIHWAVPVEREAGVPPGKIISASQKGIEVATGKGSLLIKDVQLEGKKKMATEDFLKGHRLASGEEFTATR